MARRGRCLCAFVAAALAAAPVLALERLSDRALDSVTAGGVEATARAEAWAAGLRANTISATETHVRRDVLSSFRFRRLSNGVTIAESTGDRNVEYGYARAAADARGRLPAVDCQVDLRFSVPPTMRLSERQSLQMPGRASCNCATFGLSVLPD